MKTIPTIRGNGKVSVRDMRPMLTALTTLFTVRFVVQEFTLFLLGAPLEAR